MSSRGSKDGGGSGMFLLPGEGESPTSFEVSVRPFFENQKVVQLGEAVHMTKELPLARMKLMPLLSQLGFDLILFEGSTVESWLAADFLLASKSIDPSVVESARDIALPGIWRTPEYSTLLGSFAESWQTEKPFYFASYDLQPGMGQLRADALPRLFEVLDSYSKMPSKSGIHIERLSLFSNRKEGFPNAPFSSAQMAEVKESLEWFEAWLLKVAAAVDREYKNVPHGAALRYIPKQLGRQAELWFQHSNDPDKKTFLTYQETRDRLGAEAILEMTDIVSRSQKSIVWAHHVHVFHNTVGKARHSLGHDLKSKLGNKLYTVGTFAGSGEIFSLDMDDVQPAQIEKYPEGSLEDFLTGLSSGDFFLDLSSREEAILNRETVTVVEGGVEIRSIPKKDFDAALFVQEVSRPKPFWEK